MQKTAFAVLQKAAFAVLQKAAFAVLQKAAFFVLSPAQPLCHLESPGKSKKQELKTDSLLPEKAKTRALQSPCRKKVIRHSIKQLFLPAKPA